MHRLCAFALSSCFHRLVSLCASDQILANAIHLVLAVIAYTLDQKQTSEHGAMVESAMLLGPTVFPLAFAALGGRSMRNMALWKAERGSTIKVRLNSIACFIYLLTAVTITVAGELAWESKFCQRGQPRFHSPFIQCGVFLHPSVLVPFPTRRPELYTSAFAD
jgi:NADH:ubiquinone oxidoreductase subunit 4 (subunit M)